MKKIRVAKKTKTSGKPKPGTRKSTRRKPMATPAKAKLVAKMACRHCGRPAVSYMRESLLFVPEDRQEPVEFYGYCAAHKQQVFDAMPYRVQVSYLATATHQPRKPVSIDNRIIVGEHGLRAMSDTAKRLAGNKKWPSLNDRMYDHMLSLDYEKLYLLYDVSGVYKKSFKTFGKAVNAINDFSRDVVVYYSAEGDVK